MRVSFHTLGCKVNQYETEAMAEEFRAAGHTVVGEDDKADVYVVNTCTVTNLASRKSRQFIRRKQTQDPDCIVVVTGCYAQTDPEKVAEIEGVNIICGTNEREGLVERVEAYAKARESVPAAVEKHILSYEDLGEYVSSGIITGASERTRAYIKIQEGCNRFCSYCIIPYARGPVRSRDKAEIIEEAKTLIAGGYKELVLTGINTALYGQEEAAGKTGGQKADDAFPLNGLLREINAIEGDFRIRLSSLEPAVVNADMVKLLLDIDKLCHHLHLSIQSGSDRVLGAMNRPYTRNQYLDIVKVLKEADPDYGISTDIIAGFPGETEDDFADSLDIIEKAGFCRVHAFNYSVRPGTAAEKMEGHVPPAVRKERTERLGAAGDKAAEEFCCGLTGKTRRVLTEEPAQDGRYMTGYTDNYVKVFLPAEGLETNEFYDAMLTGLMDGGMSGIVKK
ncbi:MAG: tRNA (N(6)-L-threonylcarbamoyladenosine(37)-C(2))-methylthiotransferase MtaB [Firmicutes bacterium]|nr:tRNA (N(6)-L-threonylcarbamoyladenosine(37)-C(2))-methylthiotransferase MtaB [Bacillota bacterium]